MGGWVGCREGEGIGSGGLVWVRGFGWVGGGDVPTASTVQGWSMGRLFMTMSLFILSLLSVCVLCGGVVGGWAGRMRLACGGGMDRC